MAEGLRHVTYLKVDRAEAEALTGETDLAAAARRLAAYGPREIVLTESAGVNVYADGEVHFAPFTSRSLAGRTGRGDTCFATYLTKTPLGVPGRGVPLGGGCDLAEAGAARAVARYRRGRGTAYSVPRIERR